jgi:2-keto-4-pentenoate hydratase
MTAQLERWRERLAAGERRIGWKIGINLPAIQAQLGITAPVIGHLTSAGELRPGDTHSLTGSTRVGVEPEIAVRMGRELPPDADTAGAAQAVESLGPAIELVDVDLPFEDVTAILERNIFHRGVMVGEPSLRLADLEKVRASAVRNGNEEVAAEHEPAAELPELVRLVARTLGAHGERLLAGDVVITGILTPVVWVEPGDHVEVTVDPLGTLTADFTE